MSFGRQIKPNPNEFFSFQDLRNEQCAYDQDGDESVGSRHDAQVGMQGERYGAVVVGACVDEMCGVPPFSFLSVGTSLL